MMSYEEKLVINNKLKKINDKELYKKIYILIKDEIEKDMIQNNNGIFFNLNILSDKKLLELNTFLDTNINFSESETSTLKYTNYSSDIDNTNLGLSNKEKNLIKKLNS